MPNPPIRPLPPLGSTDRAAYEFYRMLDQEERVAAERERLRAMGWQPPQTSEGVGSEAPRFDDERDAYVDLIERGLALHRATEAEARRRASAGRHAITDNSLFVSAPGGSAGARQSSPIRISGGRYGVPMPGRTRAGTGAEQGHVFPISLTDRPDAEPERFDRSSEYPQVAVAPAAAAALAELLALLGVGAAVTATQPPPGRNGDYSEPEFDTMFGLTPRDIVEPEIPVPPKDLDPEEARRLQQQFGGPLVNVPPVFDTRPETLPIEEERPPNVFVGPDPSNPPRYPTWFENRGSEATQRETTRYVQRGIGLAKTLGLDFEHTGGGYSNLGGKLKEEHYKNTEAGGGTLWSNYVDGTIYNRKTGRRILIQTVDTKADGLTPTDREWINNLRLMYNKTSGDYLILVPKGVPEDQINWEAFDQTLRPILQEIGRMKHHGEGTRTFNPDKEWTLINVRPAR